MVAPVGGESGHDGGGGVKLAGVAGGGGVGVTELLLLSCPVIYINNENE